MSTHIRVGVRTHVRLYPAPSLDLQSQPQLIKLRAQIARLATTARRLPVGSLLSEAQPKRLALLRVPVALVPHLESVELRLEDRDLG